MAQTSFPDQLRASGLPLQRKDFYQLFIYHLFNRRWKDYGNPFLEYSPRPDRPERVLAIQLSSIGDVTYTLPAVSAFKEHWPETKLEFLCEDSCAVGIRNHPDIDQLRTFPADRWRDQLGEKWDEPTYNEIRAFWNDLRRGGFDYVINLHNSPLSALIAHSLGGENASGFVINESLEFGVRGDPLNAYRFLTLSEGLGTPFSAASLSRLQVDGGEGELDFWVREDESVRDKTRGLFREHHDPEKSHVLINTGSNMENRRWGPDHCAGVVDKLMNAGVEVGLIGGPMDVDRLDEVVAKVGESPALIRWYERTDSLLEDMHLADEAEAMVSTDSGPLHLMSIRGCPVVDLAGDMWVGPWNSPSQVLRADSEDIADIPPGVVVDSVRSILEGKEFPTPTRCAVTLYEGRPDPRSFWYRHHPVKQKTPPAGTFRGWLRKMFHYSLWSEQSRELGWRAPRIDAQRLRDIYDLYWTKSPPDVNMPAPKSIQGIELLDEGIQRDIEARLKRFWNFDTVSSRGD